MLDPAEETGLVQVRIGDKALEVVDDAVRHVESIEPLAPVGGVAVPHAFGEQRV